MPRPLFRQAPPEVVTALGDALGSPVVAETAAPAGFTPTVASTLTLADGRRTFVKASGDPDRHQGLHTAVACDAALTDRTLAPPVLATVTLADWCAVAWDHLPAGHVEAWAPGDVPAILDLTARLAAGTRPCRLAGAVPFAHDFQGEMVGTARALAGRDMPDPPHVAHLTGIPLWSGLDLHRLATLEEDWVPALSGGDHLHHGDLRRDNLVRGPDGRLRIVDWTHRWTAPGWADLILLGVDLTRGGLDAERILAASVWAAAPAHEVNVLLAGWTGHWFNAAHRPEIPHAPGLRRLQHDQGRACAAWLARRLR
ncbi:MULTISPECIES: hypothetical protein [Actinoplanes]|uniref:hypothetical protein n=1 Tax=Actinoplanes TaxID=1865 RepID=UPI0005F2FC32|nr:MULTISPECIES: hypothetical protein [Actinoplanes]GLX99869.1 hypothetical protein Acsp01_02490 [Actinoplanes sp. NBRC 101535]